MIEDVLELPIKSLMVTVVTVIAFHIGNIGALSNLDHIVC